MAGSSIKSMSKRHLWAGGILLLLAGSAIGTVATSVITQRFTGYVELEDGSRVEVQGEAMIDVGTDENSVRVSLEDFPEGGKVKAGEWQLEDGRRIKVVPVDGGNGATLTMPAAGQAPTVPAGDEATHASHEYLHTPPQEKTAKPADAEATKVPPPK